MGFIPVSSLNSFIVLAIICGSLIHYFTDMWFGYHKCHHFKVSNSVALVYSHYILYIQPLLLIPEHFHHPPQIKLFLLIVTPHLTHFELDFMYDVRQRSNLILVHVDIQLSQHRLLKKLFSCLSLLLRCWLPFHSHALITVQWSFPEAGKHVT